MSPKRVYKALTICQPWANLIATGKKAVENRKWWTSHRGWFAVHAGKNTSFMSDDEKEAKELPLGAIVAVAELYTVFNLPDVERMLQNQGKALTGRTVEINERSSGGLSKEVLSVIADHEYSTGPWCYVLRNTIALPEPIPCNGTQGFWPLERDEREAIHAQLEIQAKIGGGT